MNGPALLRTAALLTFSLLPLQSARAGTHSPSAPVALSSICTPLRTDAWIGASRSQAVSIGRQPLTPELQAALPGGANLKDLQPFVGTLLWPAVFTSAPWPAVVLLHGSGGTQCDLFTDARALAARGYVTLTLTQPDSRSGSSEASGVQALQSALNFLISGANPVQLQTRPDDVALIGHSEGAGVVSIAQGLPGFGSVKAVVALDNLRRWLVGDPGAAVRSCARRPAYEVTPRVPALGFAKDAPCTETGDLGPDVKLGAWKFWQERGVPAVELVPAGYAHLTFTDRAASGAQLQTQVNLMAAWLGRWLRQDQGALASLSCLPPGFLSTQFHSALFLPGQTAETDLQAAQTGCR
ncbi:alpha/beta hydrolase family protein [Deinococcus sp. UYEF24]